MFLFFIIVSSFMSFLCLVVGACETKNSERRAFHFLLSAVNAIGAALNAAILFSK